jgi:hypothetical protein
MSDFLGRLAAQSLDLPAAIRPRQPSLFAPGGDDRIPTPPEDDGDVEAVPATPWLARRDAQASTAGPQLPRPRTQGPAPPTAAAADLATDDRQARPTEPHGDSAEPVPGPLQPPRDPTRRGSTRSESPRQEPGTHRPAVEVGTVVVPAPRPIARTQSASSVPSAQPPLSTHHSTAHAEPLAPHGTPLVPAESSPLQAPAREPARIAAARQTAHPDAVRGPRAAGRRVVSSSTETTPRDGLRSGVPDRSEPEPLTARDQDDARAAVSPGRAPVAAETRPVSSGAWEAASVVDASSQPAPSAAPTIQVTIGRVEVRAAAQATPAAPRKPPAPTLSLEDYLRGRAGEGQR